MVWPAAATPTLFYTFTSRRRDAVRVETIKTFEERLGDAVERRIAALRPGAYTRIGAAIRHVARRLRDRPEAYRLILLLTDGKPNDMDHYEGRYGVEDTRMAVREAQTVRPPRIRHNHRQEGARLCSIPLRPGRLRDHQPRRPFAVGAAAALSARDRVAGDANRSERRLARRPPSPAASRCRRHPGFEIAARRERSAVRSSTVKRVSA